MKEKDGELVMLERRGNYDTRRAERLYVKLMTRYMSKDDIRDKGGSSGDKNCEHCSINMVLKIKATLIDSFRCMMID